jgi:urate oxidase
VSTDVNGSLPNDNDRIVTSYLNIRMDCKHFNDGEDNLQDDITCTHSQGQYKSNVRKSNYKCLKFVFELCSLSSSF